MITKYIIKRSMEGKRNKLYQMNSIGNNSDVVAMRLRGGKYRSKRGKTSRSRERITKLNSNVLHLVQN